MGRDITRTKRIPDNLRKHKKPEFLSGGGLAIYLKKLTHILMKNSYSELKAGLSPGKLTKYPVLIWREKKKQIRQMQAKVDIPSLFPDSGGNHANNNNS